ncbi:hypothetical protein PAHAL_2G001900 [Panicum hallii]|uniref:Uncharacterized protein n=2 Tax=Panicum hallii TaxID=206008 RepID=A0A2S3GV05_9POAL|nr:dnaJ homolog subfamily C member 21-like [Panicum hallii]XP_025799941.1 dnaJ homolog subfamily C member 21-like [Panicum hallii]PAN09179.1 hypothetical protein PAHAL_2G001900 [Panicum hallii]PAN09180.1 hypothetical protein PAHAL_2G001900 [Panicum hallii]
MTPSSATPRRRRRRRNRNVPVSVRGSAAASARALAAGLWRLRHAQRMKAAGGPHNQAPSKLGEGRRCPANKHLAAPGIGIGIGSHCQCCSRNHHHHHHGILDKIDACVEPYGSCSSSAMEKATKWASRSSSPLVLLMEAELEKARGHISELEEERRVMTKRLERFLRDLAEDKASWKARVRDKARHAVAALKEELSAERAHRRQLEQANAKLMRDLAEARSSAKQQAQSYEMERKARELMEEACSELTREVEEDQAEVELLRRECLRMREEMEEERRMLQMAEVWREERVQMKLSDAKLALETKYAQLSHLQAEMEAFLRSKDSSCQSSTMREARFISDAAAAAASAELRSRGRASQHDDDEDDEVDADSVFEHFRRKETNRANSPASSNSNVSAMQSVSPATDLFLAKVDDAYANGGSSADMDYDGGRDSCSWLGTSDRSASVANGNSGLESGASRRSVGKNTALIRRLWRSAIAESRKKTGGGWSPSSDRRSSVTPEAPPPPPMAVAVAPPQQSKQSLREKLMEARMDDHKPVQDSRQPNTKPISSKWKGS